MIELTESPISPERLINLVKTDGSGCVMAYVGVIRGNSHGKMVLSVEYIDPGTAREGLRQIAEETTDKWPLEGIAICHRTSKLKVGDFNIGVAVAAGHREEGFAACQYVIDRFKETLPTRKRETYQDGSILVEG